MESVRKLEVSLIGWYKQWPHLPKDITKFISEWAWLFTLIGVIICALGVFVLMSTAFFGAALLTGVGGVYGAAVGRALTLAILVSVVFSVLIIYLAATAIMPLKEKRKRGWDLLFYVALINLAGTVINALVNYSLFGLVGAAIGAVISGYILFEMRDSFITHTSHKVVKK